MSHRPPAVPPFAHLRLAAGAAAVYLVATLTWAGLGSALPGGRWFAVHLFTVGVVTNLVAALTHHFAQTLLHTGSSGLVRGRVALLNAGAVALLAGRALPSAALFAAGGTALILAVAWLYLDLRRQRKRSLTGRFAYIVRAYERACSAFFHGALLGVMMGTGILAGSWYGAARLAHLHVNVLGWGGLTLLATVVFFGPTIMRVRMDPDAAATAPAALRHGATGLSVGVLALLATGWAGGPQTALRLVAAAGLAVYAAAAVAVCLPVLRASRRASSTAHTRLVRGACVWFPVAAWGDVAAVATGQLWLLDAVGAALLAGVLAQAILAALGYLGPLVVVAGSQARTEAGRLLNFAPRARPAALNAGVACLVAAVPAGRVTDGLGGGLAAAGWLGIVAAVVAQLLATGYVIGRYPAVGTTSGRGDPAA